MIEREDIKKEKIFFKDKFNEKILNKEIFKEIQFRKNREIKNLWRDEDLLIFRQKEIKKPEIPQVEVFPGTLDALSGFIAKEPQRDEQGGLRYLLTSGLAVEAITGVSRFHHDMDLVLFDLTELWWKQYVTDNVTPQKYWAEMKFDPAYLEETAWTARFEVEGAEKTVLTVHPAIILIQKLSNAWGRPPRERDINDARNLIRYWLETKDGDITWEPIIETAIKALPQNEQAGTTERLDQLLVPMMPTLPL